MSKFLSRKLVYGFPGNQESKTYTGHLTPSPDLGSVKGKNPGNESKQKTLYKC
jgi:hypothetical protein